MQDIFTILIIGVSLSFNRVNPDISVPLATAYIDESTNATAISQESSNIPFPLDLSEPNPNIPFPLDSASIGSDVVSNNPTSLVEEIAEPINSTSTSQVIPTIAVESIVEPTSTADISEANANVPFPLDLAAVDTVEPTNTTTAMDEIDEPTNAADIDEVIEPGTSATVEDIAEPTNAADIDEVIKPGTTAAIDEIAEPTNASDINGVIDSGTTATVEDIAEPTNATDINEVIDSGTAAAWDDITNTEPANATDIDEVGIAEPINATVFESGITTNTGDVTEVKEIVIPVNTSAIQEIMKEINATAVDPTLTTDEKEAILDEKYEEVENKTFATFSEAFHLNATDTEVMAGRPCVEILEDCEIDADCCGDTIVCTGRKLCRPKAWVPIHVVD